MTFVVIRFEVLVVFSVSNLEGPNDSFLWLDLLTRVLENHWLDILTSIFRSFL